MEARLKLYAWLLKLYPARFREEYQMPMERQFQDEYSEADNRLDRARLWLRALADLATSVPGELFRELQLDLKHSLRIYRNRFFVTALAVLALGLAMGASTGVFSVLNALMLRRLPFSNPAQLVDLWLSPVSAMNGRAAFTAWHRASPYLENAATFSSSDMNLTGTRAALRVKTAETSANFFQLLGIEPVIGRTFARDEDIFGHDSIAVISYGLWQQFFGGNPRVAGASLHLNGRLLTVVGVAPASFDYPGKTGIWTPTAFDFERMPRRGAFLFQTIGRLKPAVTLRSAQDLFQAEVHRAQDRTLHTDEQNRPHIVSLQDELAGSVRQASWVLAGMTLLVLLTACANVAQLLLSRATERRGELELRTALGASRARLLQQLITEATLLTMAGAAIGLVIAHWTARIASSVAPAQLATQGYTVLDWRVLAFAVALALVMGGVFGIVPAWLIGRLQPSGHIVRDQIASGSAPASMGTKGARTGLVVLQAALTLTLLTSSLVMGRTFLRLLHVNLGFRTASVVTLNVSLQGTRHSGPGEWQYYSEALQRLRSLSGVQAAGAVSYLPLASDIYMASAFKLDSGQRVEQIVMNAVMPGYFSALGTRFLAGRDFADTDTNRSERSVIVNDAFANTTGLGRTIVGRRLTALGSNTPYRIAGVVTTARFAGPAYPGAPQIYWPIQEEPPPALTFVARVTGPPEAYLARCRDAVRAVDPEVPIYDVKTLDQRLDDVLARPRFYTATTLFLALLAALLAAVGIYGTAAHSIAQRKHEMGIRMALGASYQRIRGMLLYESLMPILVGAASGIVLALASGRYLAHLLENTAQPTVWTCTIGAALLLLAGLTAAWTATGRVLSVDPAEALRAE